ncbi:hypothetical protein [Rhodopseudomonas sp. B29]|uniref:hypothetical protein n=1 Tax=Rhodopseudomonas sp. B29 TaxID=95607 RepID=UPI0004CF2E2E|nr:hypothetical protein [Rhodopseudomonas sp. B29]
MKPSTDPTDDMELSTPRYAYRASLVGAAQQYELTEAGLSWQIGGRSGLWPYGSIAKVRLSFRPVSMQSRRFRADLVDQAGHKLRILSTSWQTVALMAPQDQAYRAFIVELHRRMQAAGSRAELVGGLPPLKHTFGLVGVALVAAALLGLLARAVATGQWGGAVFLIGFACLFLWQVGGFIRRNRPRNYTFEMLPADLLP